MKRNVLTLGLMMGMVFGLTLFGCGKEKEEAGAASVEAAAETAGEEQPGETGEMADREGNKEEGETVDISALASRLLKEISYEDELSELDLETAGMFINFGDADITEAAIYESSGATAEEIIVLLCADAANAGKAEEALKQRVEEQKKAFEDYVPEELKKLGEAVIVTNGNVAILSVSNSPDIAREILSGK